MLVYNIYEAKRRHAICCDKSTECNYAHARCMVARIGVRVPHICFTIYPLRTVESTYYPQLLLLSSVSKNIPANKLPAKSSTQFQKKVRDYKCSHTYLYCENEPANNKVTTHTTFRQAKKINSIS